MWGGRFGKPLDPRALRYTTSLPVDRRLFEWDVLGSIAHARMLGAAKIIPSADAEKLVRGLQSVRREIESGVPGAVIKPVARSVFVVEKDQRLQDAMREGFKEKGFRVYVAADPARAVDRFNMQPFDALVLDAGTTGEEGRFTFEHILKDAVRKEVSCAGILILSEEQASWAKEVPKQAKVAVLVRPLTLKQLQRRLEARVPAPSSPNGEQPA